MPVVYEVWRGRPASSTVALNNDTPDICLRWVVNNVGAGSGIPHNDHVLAKANIDNSPNIIVDGDVSVNR